MDVVGSGKQHFLYVYNSVLPLAFSSFLCASKRLRFCVLSFTTSYIKKKEYVSLTWQIT